MSFWPGKGLFSTRNKRIQRVRVVWVPPEKSKNCDIAPAEPTEEQPKQASTSSETSTTQESLAKDEQDKKSKRASDDHKRGPKSGKGNRGRKRRHVKPNIDLSSNSDVSENPNSKIIEGGNDVDDKIADEQGLSVVSEDVPEIKKRVKKKKSVRRSRKPDHLDDCTIEKREDEIKGKGVKSHNREVGGSEDHLKRLERDWEDGEDSGGQISRCSSSSSLSSSCSHHSLIKHYTNIMMNCCDDQFDEDCNVVKNKIDRILKSQWKDRLNRSKEKSSGPAEPANLIPQTSLKHSTNFKLRPARLPLNKKTWSKLKKSNQNSDWLFEQ